MTDFENKTVVVTGGAHGIGKCICEEFAKEGARVCVIDRRENPYFVGDLADKTSIENICIDGGMTKLMIYHGDHGWRLES